MPVLPLPEAFGPLGGEDRAAADWAAAGQAPDTVAWAAMAPPVVRFARHPSVGFAAGEARGAFNQGPWPTCWAYPIPRPQSAKRKPPPSTPVKRKAQCRIAYSPFVKTSTQADPLLKTRFGNGKRKPFGGWQSGTIYRLGILKTSVKIDFFRKVFLNCLFSCCRLQCPEGLALERAVRSWARLSPQNRPAFSLTILYLPLYLAELYCIYRP